MARYTGSSCKKCRRLETKLFLKGSKCFNNCVLSKREGATAGKRGGTGKKRRGKLSEYAIHLNEKQKARFSTGMGERQFSNLFKKATKTVGQTGENFLGLLETRLDNIVRRAGFALSLRTARQIVFHGHILINNKKIDIPSYQVKEGDKITLSKEMANSPVVKFALEETEKRELRPSFLEYQADKNTATLVRQPARDEMSQTVNEQLIIEYYSK